MKPNYEREELYESIRDEKDISKRKAKIPAYRESNGPQTMNGKLHNAQKVRIRKAPSMESDVLTIMNEGSIVEIMRFDGPNSDLLSFYKVKTPDGIGYVNKNFCSII